MGYMYRIIYKGNGVVVEAEHFEHFKHSKHFKHYEQFK